MGSTLLARNYLCEILGRNKNFEEESYGKILGTNYLGEIMGKNYLGEIFGEKLFGWKFWGKNYLKEILGTQFLGRIFWVRIFQEILSKKYCVINLGVKEIWSKILDALTPTHRRRIGQFYQFFQVHGLLGKTCSDTILHKVKSKGR